MRPNEAKLLYLLSNNDVTFFIPPYQRNYEWTDDQCKVFLEDILKTYKANSLGGRTEHFFGSVTYFQTETAFGQPNKLVLIDGQQRITTTMLFLIALRDILDDDNLKGYIDSKYLKNENVKGDSEYKIKLKQVETDWAAYRDLVLGNPVTDKEKSSAVYKNYRYFVNKLSELQEKGNDLNAFIEKGLDKFSIITIELQPQQNEWENPQEIFESMNSLGKPLSLADLVRNYLLLGLDPDTQSSLYSQYWLRMENTIPRLVSDFIRDYMQGHEKRSYPKATETNHKELYGFFKDIFGDIDSKILLKSFSEYSEIYAYIVLGTSCGDAEIDGILSDLRYINVTTAYSFYMMLLHEWKSGTLTNKDVRDVLNVFKTYFLRRRLIALASGENKAIPTLVRYIPDIVKADDKTAKTFEILSKQESNLRLPNDIEIRRTVDTMNFYNFKYSKFILALVEESITRSRPDLSDQKLQKEHIMPNTLNDDWRKALGDDCEDIHQELVNTIGNITLIRHNQELGQKKFSDKKAIYDNNAGLQIARTEITNQDHWSRDTIENRAKWLIEYLLNNVMPIPDAMRKTNNFIVKEGRRLSFQELQLVGLDINFIDDTSIVAHVVGDKDVEFEGKKWKLSPLTREIQTRRGKVNSSGSYQGAQYWEYDGIKLADIM